MNEIHFHRRNLPHFYRANSTYFITYRLKGTIPFKILEELRRKYSQEKIPVNKEEKYELDKLFFLEYDNYLDSNKKVNWLVNKGIAEKVKYTFHYYDKKEYTLICYTIMPNHVHLVFHLLDKERKLSSQTRLSVLQPNVSQTILSAENYARIDRIMKSIKGISARESNKILKRKGSFWQSESYDHIVRDEDELERIIKYVIMNPVKAKLVNKWEDWEYTYLSENW